MTLDRAQQAKLVRQLEAFRERLLDIDTRNPSVRLRRETQERAFDLARLGAGTLNSVYARLTRGAASVRLVPDNDESPEAIKNRQHLRKLWRAAQSRTEETGLRELYLGLCWLTGHLDPKAFVRGPLFVVPASLEVRRGARGAGWHLALREDELIVNEAILAAVRKHRGVRLNADLADNALEELANLADDALTKREAGATLFTRLSKLAVKAGLHADVAAYSPQPLAPQTNRDLGSAQHPLFIISHLAVGMFPQSSTALYADMESMLERAHAGEIDQGIVDNLLEAAADPENEGSSLRVDLDAVSEAEVHSVVPADPSQFAVLAKAQSAECLVVRGPPGTGKSQVIVNLVADALARDKRVLVVCQKRPAIDVVFDRLSDHQLGVSAAVIHDAAGDRPALYKKLHTLMQKGDAPQPPRGKAFRQLGAEVDQLTQHLRAIIEPLASDVHGLRLYEIYALATSGFRPRFKLPPDLVARSYADLGAVFAAIQEARAGTLRFDQPDHPLALRESFAQKGHLERHRASELFQRLVEAARGGPGIVLEDQAALPVLRRALHVFEVLRRRWYRFLSPAFWMAQRRMRSFSGSFAGHPTDLWTQLLDRGERLASLLAELALAMSPRWREAMLQQVSAPERLAARATETLQALQTEFDAIAQHDRIRDRLDLSATAVVMGCAQVLAGDVAWGEHLRQEVFLHWIDEAEGRFPVLRGRPFTDYERLRTLLESRLQEKRTAVAKQLSHSLSARALTPTFEPSETAHGNRRAATSWNALAHEFGKQRRVKPIRVLLQEFPWQMRQVVPCWLTSPEVASEIFPLERGYFDLVIFDEASQLPMERALPVLYRAKQVVIAGDEQQMPPSRFFVASLDEEEEPLEADSSDASQDEAKFADSLLSQAKRIYGFDYLAWHYRSRHQELIEFSNHAFYDGRLCVAANIDRAPTAAPMRWIDARGTWMNNINPIEVKLAVDELARVLGESETPPTVGIITFNQKQQEAIQNEIEARGDADPAFADLYQRAQTPASGKDDDKPFVKNIENVQGDERDHIIFSIGYGPGPDGIFRRRFGPLSMSGGENRLNVAATRARVGVTVICSFDPDILATDDAKNRGPALLKRYLQYVRAVSSRDRDAAARVIAELNPDQRAPQSAREQVFDSPFEESVYDALRERGYQVETQWGAGGYRIDLAVVDPTDPTRFCLGIECDGATYHSGRSVRERDIARQSFLESRGWTIHRIWSRDFWQNPQGEINSVLALLPDAKGARPPGPPTPSRRHP
jgi:very-short-patch-repair endonuclease